MAEFRSEVQPLVRAFRTEMVRLTSDLQGAFASGATDAELQALCRAIVDSKVGPALADLSKRLRNPVRPFHRVLVDKRKPAWRLRRRRYRRHSRWVGR